MANAPLEDFSDVAPLLTRFLLDVVWHHCQPPIILGVGAASVENKLSGCLWGVYLETKLKDVFCAHTKSSQAWCTDMGAEFALNDYRIQDTAQLLPTAEFSLDDFVDDDGEALQPPSRADPNVGADDGLAPEAVESGAVEDDGDELLADHGDGDVHPPPAPASGEADPDEDFDPYESFADFLFPASLRSPGLCHISHNASKDVCSVLHTWSELAVSISSIVAIFSHTGRLERFKEVCITGTRFERCEHLFGKNCPEFRTARWGSIYQVVVWLIQRCTVIISAWRARRYSDQPSGVRLLTSPI